MIFCSISLERKITIFHLQLYSRSSSSGAESRKGSTVKNEIMEELFSGSGKR
jgi:hypothetical protein